MALRSGHQSRIRKESVIQKGTTFVGLDVHKEAINVAMLLPGETRPVQWPTSNEVAAVRRMVRKLQRSAVGELQVCYEAGPCGYAVQRAIRALGVSRSKSTSRTRRARHSVRRMGRTGLVQKGRSGRVGRLSGAQAGDTLSAGLALPALSTPSARWL